MSVKKKDFYFKSPLHHSEGILACLQCLCFSSSGFPVILTEMLETLALSPRSSSDSCPRLTPKAQTSLLIMIPIILQHVAFFLCWAMNTFPLQGINSHPFGRVQHFPFHFSLSPACPGRCSVHLRWPEQ